jgi:hypothetical protein
VDDDLRVPRERRWWWCLGGATGKAGVARMTTKRKGVAKFKERLLITRFKDLDSCEIL